MRAFWVLFKKELMSLFLMPVAYVLGFVFLLVQGYTFWILVAALNNPGVQVEQSVMQLFFGGTFFFWILVILLASVITMRLFAEEKKSGTFDLLMSAPVRLIELVLAKYLAPLFFYGMLWLPTLCFVLVLDHSVSLDWGPVVTGYLGVFLLGALFHAVGLFASSLTQNQIISAVLCFGLCLLLFSLSFLEFFVIKPEWSAFFNSVNMMGHMDDFGKGILDSQIITYYLSLTALFLFFSLKVLKFQSQ